MQQQVLELITPARMSNLSIFAIQKVGIAHVTVAQILHAEQSGWQPNTVETKHVANVLNFSKK